MNSTPFTPQAKVYPQQEYNSLSYHQQQSIWQLKASEGWIDQVTPPPGFNIDRATGFAVPSNAIVNAFRTASISAMGSNNTTNATPPPSFINLPPAPAAVRPTQPSDTSQAGASFGRSGIRQHRNDSASVSISTVSINGQPYTGDVFDQNGNKLT